MMLTRSLQLARFSSLNSLVIQRCMSDVAQKRIGIIGVGQVGNAVTDNLLKKNYLVGSIYDVHLDRCKPFPCKVAKSPREIVEENDIIITALPMPPDVKSAFEGDSGILAALDSSKIWIDHSTTDYEQTQRFNELVVAKGSRMLEAPITGGLEALKKGQMTVMMAGDKDLAEQVRPLMKASFGNVLYTGPLGTALIPKVFSNMLTCVHLVAMAEVLMVAKRANLDLKTFWDCIRASAGNSFVWETGGPMVFQGTYDPSFTIALQNKDNQLGYDIAKKYKVPLEYIGHAQQTFHRAMFMYGEDAPCYSAPRMLEEALGESLRCEEFKDWSYSIQNVDGSSVIRHHGIKLTQDEN